MMHKKNKKAARARNTPPFEIDIHTICLMHNRRRKNMPEVGEVVQPQSQHRRMVRLPCHPASRCQRHPNFYSCKDAICTTFLRQCNDDRRYHVRHFFLHADGGVGATVDSSEAEDCFSTLGAVPDITTSRAESASPAPVGGKVEGCPSTPEPTAYAAGPWSSSCSSAASTGLSSMTWSCSKEEGPGC